MVHIKALDDAHGHFFWTLTEATAVGVILHTALVGSTSGDGLCCLLALLEDGV